MMFKLLTIKEQITTALAALAFVGFLASATFGVGYYKGQAAGKAQQLKQAVKAYETRNGIETIVDGLGHQQLCIELGGLPDQCAELRGLDQATKGQ